MKRIATVVVLVGLLWATTGLALGNVNQPDANVWLNFKEQLGKTTELMGNSGAAALQLQKAKQIYEQMFAPISKSEPALNLELNTAWAAAKEAVQNGDKLELMLATETIEKTTLALVFHKFKALMQAGKVTDAWSWFTVIAAQLRLESNHSLVKKMQAAKARGKVSARQAASIVTGLNGALAAKVTEEIDEALEAAKPESGQADLAEAQVKAAEGLGYYYSIRSFISQKLGYKEAALLQGLLSQIRSSLAAAQVETASQAAETLKEELEEVEAAKKVSRSEFSQTLNKLQVILAHAAAETKKGEVEQAKILAKEAWSSFTKVEAEIRRLDVARYVKIEKLFPKVQEQSTVADIQELNNLFKAVLAVKSGQGAAGQASLDQTVVSSFENIQPFFFLLLALLGIYPVYLIIKAFGWGHRAWRNIGIFIILLIVPVFMEALGRLGVEFKITSLQALSFTVNEYAKMAWGLIVLAAFLFAISGLRQFCAQFGVKAIGVRQHPEEPIAAETEALS